MTATETAAFTGWSNAASESRILGQINLDTAWPVVEQFSEIIRLSGSPEEREAFEIMIRHATDVGATGIVAVRYDATEVMQGVTEVLCYGTAVVLEPR